MLTTKVITPKQGESYYAKENYYSTEESVEHSQWMGKGAKKLGLKGKVKPKQFKKLLYGELPNGTQFRARKKERDGYKERAGLDCTFSAPKSFSLLLLAGGREELENAQQKAVLNTLKIIERDYATTRVSKGGKVTTINTDNLVVALFDHDTSRELDPHRHTHCVILNMTEHNDRWYAFRNDDIHANKKLLGMIYQNQLAIEVQKLGYEIEPKGHGQFEIKGFTEEQLQSFSKRRQQIKSQLGEESTWKEREKVWDKTRLKKGEPIPREELQAYWRKELEELGVSYPQPTKCVKKRVSEVERNQTPDTFIDVNQAVSEGIQHCSERTVSFKPEEIQKFVLTEVGKYEQQELEQAIATSDELIHLDKQVTTQSALLREIATIKLVKQGQGNVKALTNTEIVDEFIEGKNLTEGQRDAILLASTTQDQIIAWQGKAGVGKTYALNEFKQIAQREGCVVKGFAPSAKAAKVLSEEMGIETTTVARKLVSNSWKDKTERQQIWIVDEAGLLGAKDAHELLQKAEAENARVLLVGDTRQLSSVAAGNPFKSLQQAGIATAYLNQSLRQKTKDLKHAVDLLSDGKIAEGIKVFETNKRILEIKDAGTRASHIAQDYLKLTPEERKQTLIIAGTHQERENLIDSIRGGLKEEGSLGEDVTIQRLKSKNLTNVQKKYAHYYEPGNIVIPLSNYKRWGLEKGQQYTVKAVEGDSLVLLGKDGQERRLSPTWFKHKEIYEAIDTNIAVGDRLRWGKNDKQLNRINGGEFVVTKIDGGSATICNEQGRHEQIDIKEPQHLDHALVSTTYSSQGVTAKKVLVSVTNDFTLSQESFYLAASRAKYDLHLYVEDRARLIEKAQTSRSQANPLELIREHQRKEVVANKTTSTRVKEQNNQTVQSNHERHQTPQPNIQRNSQRSSSPNPPKIRRDRKQSQQPNRPSGIDLRGLEELTDGINRVIEEEETERITESIESLNRSIRNSILSDRRIGRLNRTIRDYTRKQERVRGVKAIRDSLEESILESDPELINSLQKLSQSLESQSSSLSSRLGSLQESINKYAQELSQHIPEQDESRNPQQPERINGTDIGRRSILFAETSSTEARPRIIRDVSEKFRELANQARNMPLEEVVQRLGLEPDHYTPNFYKISQVYAISIIDQQFYDHLNQKGGGGAIDLVMHVNDCDFKEAVEWLNGNSINLTPIKQANSFLLRPNSEETSKRAVRFSKQTLHPTPNTEDSKPKPFSPPVPDESKWSAVKDYLVNTRKLPESTIDFLHKNGSIYADYKQNAVFIRKNMPGRVTGASLRGTYNDSDFKGLSKGTQRDAGWFALQKGQGELERIVLTESPIDAISAAAVSKSQETTLFLSTDGSGSVPLQFLQQKLVNGKQIIVAYDNDEAGNHMAKQVMEQLPNSHRVTPKLGKDWNEQILYSQGSQEQKRHIFRQEYEKFRKVVDNDPKLSRKNIKGKDIAVAMLVLKAEAEKPSGESLVNRVGKVLTQSDQIREWKDTMPENELRAKVKDYIMLVYEQASTIRESILTDRQQNQGIEFER